MTNEELIALATRVKDGKATPEETKVFLDEFGRTITELKQYLASLPTLPLQ